MGKWQYHKESDPWEPLSYGTTLTPCLQSHGATPTHDQALIGSFMGIPGLRLQQNMLCHSQQVQVLICQLCPRAMPTTEHVVLSPYGGPRCHWFTSAQTTPTPEHTMPHPHRTTPTRGQAESCLSRPRRTMPTWDLKTTPTTH